MKIKFHKYSIYFVFPSELDIPEWLYKRLGVFIFGRNILQLECYDNYNNAVRFGL